MKTLFLLITFFAVSVQAQETNKPVKVPTTLIVRTALHEDMFLENPNGIEKKQYFKVFEQHILIYKYQGKEFTATNEIPTDRIIAKDMIRTAKGWMEKPKQ